MIVTIITDLQRSKVNKRGYKLEAISDSLVSQRFYLAAVEKIGRRPGIKTMPRTWTQLRTNRVHHFLTDQHFCIPVCGFLGISPLN